MDFARKPLSKYAKYTYVYSTKSMRRILNNESLSAKDVFIIKQEIGKKSTYPFMDFSDLSSFSESKIGQLSMLNEKIKQKLSSYLNITFLKKNIEEVHRLSKNSQQSIKKIIVADSSKVNIINTLAEEGKDYVDAICNQLKALNASIKISHSTTNKKDRMNIRLIRNKLYYVKNNTTDEYNPALPITQHITVEDFNFTNASALRAVIKELFIKSDVYAKHVSLVDWSSYDYKNCLTFGVKKNEKYYFLKILPSGKMQFEEKELSLFNQSDFDDLISIFGEDESIEGVVKNDKGEINIITRTTLFTLPQFENIFNKLQKEDEDYNFKIIDILGWMSEIEIKKDKRVAYDFELSQWPDENISKSELLVLISDRNIKKKLATKIFESTGKVFKVYMRDQSKYELMDSNLDIHSYSSDNKLYYYVGTIGEGMRTKIGRASIVREISGFNNSPIFFNKLLPLMNVDFVRYGDLTVVPFPFKYLREWILLDQR